MASTAAGKINISVNVLEVTKARVDEMSRLTFRGKGDVIDLAIARMWNDMRAGRVDLLEAVCIEHSTEGGETGIPEQG